MTREPSVEAAAALLRLSLAAMYLAHAGLKVFTFTLAGTAQFFAAQGFPAFLAYPVTIAEAGAAVLLALGLATRPVALAMLPVLLGATWVHLPNGWVFNAPGGGWEYPLFLILVSVAVALLGPGRWALRLAPAALQVRP